MVLLVLTVWLGLGLAYIVSILALAGGLSRVYSFLAALSALGVAAGLLVGYMASMAWCSTWCIVACPLWMTGAALLVGNGFGGFSGRPAANSV
jgi:hypothetical protein